jgi:UDP-glucuronate decarboxylase
MFLFLTGGTGFFGKALIRHWSTLNNSGLPVPEVTALSRSPEKFLSENPEFRLETWLKFHQGDILQPETFPSGASFTHLLHAAADSTLGPQLNPLERYTQIVDGTRNLLEYAVLNRISRFLLTSSGGVYGPQPVDMSQIPEAYNGMPDPLNAKNAYSVAKRCAEHLCALYQEKYGLSTVIARCFAFVGRDLPLDVHFAIGNFVRDALKEEEIRVSGDGSPIRSYMDQRDLANWLVRLLKNGNAGQAYNVGSDQAISIRELAYLVRATLAPQKTVRIRNITQDSRTRSQYVPSIAKAQNDLNLSLNYTLEASVREMAAPYQL